MSVHRTRNRKHREPVYVAEPPPADTAGDGQLPEAPPAAPRDLWSAVDVLTRSTSSRLRRDGGATERVSLPSLWDQLVEAIDSGAGKKTGGGQRGKAPCDDSALSLTIEIATAVRDGCVDLGIKRTRDVPNDLRSIVSTINRRRVQEELDRTLTSLKSWAARIRTTISNDPDRTWRMHGAACRVCSSTTVPVWDDDGNESRQPALIVHSDRGVIHRIECGFCGSVLAGDSLTELIRDVLKLPFTHFTPPSVYVHAATRPRLECDDTPGQTLAIPPADHRDAV